ncbi:TSUP family transporter [Staphylococcus simiae]|uniref:TSUP family transporter n=1 Tax=Staphylococcus simiae TaxID=308354 RepID=UPI001A969E44|nr:TSUP family transporter [Staphylococcus simiae]MBO1199568.1 TSUP family transporter [Staphylococcus simiae]MBO1201844.1 TSUP family transporter [Staphylococcus simiae]MBO1204049.1 TSUP family transporter [Staphylococcus simiae]MBO1211585.1 TSUP family transporter [Staphylococcus simiae]MBO1230284.1 TSUP family transporter [Staphylococcus simiae]
MDLSLTIISTIIVFGFVAAFIDSVVGGGGLISTPALLAIGLPPSVALGTNKLASSFGSFTSALRFIRSGKVDLKVVSKLFIFVFLASSLGAFVATMIPSQILKPLIIIALTSVFIFTIFKKDWGSVRTFTHFTVAKAILFAGLFIVIGFYDGFVGGGTGSFMLFVLLLFGFDFLSAAGNAKVLNFASNLGALVLFMALGQVNYVYGLIMAASMIVGSYVGAQFAIKQGVGYIKVLFIVITAILIVKNIYDYLQQIVHH